MTEPALPDPLRPVFEAVSAAEGTLAKFAALKKSAGELSMPIRHGMIDYYDTEERLIDFAASHGLVDELTPGTVELAIKQALTKPALEVDVPHANGQSHMPGDRGADEPPPIGGVDKSPLIKAKAYEWREPGQIARRAWLYGRHYVRGFVSATIGRPGLGKTSLAVTEILDMATATRILDPLEREPLRVWYIGEDPADEIERRFAAGCAFHHIGREQVVGRLFVNSTLDLPAIRIAQQGTRGAAVVNEQAVAALAEQITSHWIDVLILDPLIKFHGVAEADPAAMEVVMRPLSELARSTRIAIDLLHHTRKQAAGVSTAATVDDGRGASSIIAAVRSARVLNPMSQQEADRAGITEGDRWRYLRLDSGKTNMAPPEAARWLQHASEILPCGESVGVAAAWQFPDAFAGFSANDLPRIRELARTGAHRSDPRSPEWFGVAVADMIGADLDNKRDRARVHQMIKTWLKTKVLDTENRHDDQRKERTYIVPGTYDAAE